MRYRRAPDISVTAVDDGSFLVEPETQDIFWLDALAAGVWNALEEPASVTELRDLLAEAFPGTEPGRIAADLETLLAELSQRRLIEAA